MTTNQTTPVATNANDIRDIKPPVEIPSGWEWLWWALGALILARFCSPCGNGGKSARRKFPSSRPFPPTSAQSKSCRKRSRSFRQPKPFVIAVSDTARLYLEERFNFRAPERTTEEFLHELQRHRSADAATRRKAWANFSQAATW